MFDVTMGWYNGAETCELIGAYMLSFIAPIFKDEVGLYRDNGIAVCKTTQREIEKIKQEVSNAFKSNGLKITIDTNKKIVDFLDVTFDLTSGNYNRTWNPTTNYCTSTGRVTIPPCCFQINGFLARTAILFAYTRLVYVVLRPFTLKKAGKLSRNIGACSKNVFLSLNLW